MRIAICDDEQIYLDYLKDVINKFNVVQNDSMDIQLFHNAEELLFEMGDTIAFDLLILDIHMGKMNGMELAKRIRSIDANVYIVFLTGATDYVFDGYEVGALRYLLKPIKEKQLFDIFKEVKSKLASSEIQYLIIKINRENIKINLDDLIYIEAMGHYVIIYSKEKTYEVKISMNDLEKKLDLSYFVRVHRSYIVNIKHVEKINKESCVLTKNYVVNVSRKNYYQLNEAFIHFYRRIKID